MGIIRQRLDMAEAAFPRRVYPCPYLWFRAFAAASAALRRSSGGFFIGLFRRRFGCRLCRRFRSSFLRRGGFFSSRRGDRRFFFGRLFIRIASIIRNVETGPLEDKARSSAQQALHLSMSPLWQAAEIFWALAERFVAHRLERFKILAALLTRILVGWHESVGLNCSAKQTALSLH